MSQTHDRNLVLVVKLFVLMWLRIEGFSMPRLVFSTRANQHHAMIMASQSNDAMSTRCRFNCWSYAVDVVSTSSKGVPQRRASLCRFIATSSIQQTTCTSNTRTSLCLQRDNNSDEMVTIPGNTRSKNNPRTSKTKTPPIRKDDSNDANDDWLQQQQRQLQQQLNHKERPPSMIPSWKPPPAPEDFITLTGDILALSVYAIADHFVGRDLATLFRRIIVPSQSLDELSQQVQLPVWVDQQQYSGPDQMHALLVRLVQEQNYPVAQYSWILQPTGQATTVLLLCWFISSYIHSAWLFRNTIDCSTQHALLKTAQTWLTCTLLMMIIVLVGTMSHDWLMSPISDSAASTNSNIYSVMTSTTSDVLATVPGVSPEQVEGSTTSYSSISFTKADVTYIVDSLSVITVWRFMASQLFGGINR